MTTALVLGKFAPLHQGHQYLIETALSENSRVIVVIYNAADVIDIPLDARAAWIRQIYPSVEVVEAADGPTIVGNTPEIKRMHEDYLLSLLKNQKIDAFYSSEFYGEHISRAFKALDRRVDNQREKFPISGTLLRDQLYTYRQFVHPVVYRDLIVKAVFLGAPSTGKTTIAREMALRRNTVWMPEYGREYWDQFQVNRRLTQEQLIKIAEGHIEREECLFKEANREIFIDTDASTTLLFSYYYHGTATSELKQLADNAAKRYDLFFLCETDIPYENTWDRSGDANRDDLQAQIKEYLAQKSIPYVSLTGNLESRVETVIHHLEMIKRF